MGFPGKLGVTSATDLITGEKALSIQRIPVNSEFEHFQVLNTSRSRKAGIFCVGHFTTSLNKWFLMHSRLLCGLSCARGFSTLYYNSVSLSYFTHTYFSGSASLAHVHRDVI